MARTGWQAELELGFTPGPGGTALSHRRRRGPLAVQRPFYPEGEVCHVYLLHPPGGVVGGDSLHVRTRVSPGAHALVTTPGAAKFYLSAGDIAQQVQILTLAAGASLEWLPQENIFFSGAVTGLKTRIELAREARFIGWEIHCLGRPVIGERFEKGHADFQLQVARNRVPLLLEQLVVTPERLDGAASLRGLPVSATMVATPATRAELEQVREVLPDEPIAGVTLLDGLLVVRYLGSSTEQCRSLFTHVWASIRPAVIGHPACPPRIWYT